MSIWIPIVVSGVASLWIGFIYGVNKRSLKDPNAYAGFAAIAAIWIAYGMMS